MPDEMGIPSPAHEAWRLIFELMMEHRRRYQAALAELDLTFMQAHMLKRIPPGEAMTMSELAGALACDASNITGIVDRLEARGAVERRSAAHDRRVKTVAVTEAGAELRDEVMGRMHEPPPAIGALSPADQRVLRDVLRRAVDPVPSQR